VRDKASSGAPASSSAARRRLDREIRPRKRQRLEIDSPVTVGLRVLGNGGNVKFGQLSDIGERGARFCLDQPLPVDTPVHLLVHFRDPYERTITLGFEAVVIRARQQEPFEIAVRFRSGPRYFSGDLAHFMKREKLKMFEVHRELKPQGHGKGRRESIPSGAIWIN